MKLTDQQERWLQALESGKYNQTKEVLNDGKGGFCCLGVACDIFEEELGLIKQEDHITAEFEQKNVISYKSKEDYSFYAEVPPNAVKEILNLRTNGGDVKYGYAAPDNHLKAYDNFVQEVGYCLVEMNDDGKSFKEIAEKVRANPQFYFKE